MTKEEAKNKQAKKTDQTHTTHPLKEQSEIMIIMEINVRIS
ncbi:MAG: hypothetical protein AAF591_01980 [Verrucomicrobiota bacterium]